MTPLTQTVGGGTVNSFTWTFTATNAGNVAPASMTVPAGWTAPTAAAGPGHVTIGAGTCGSTFASITGTGPWVITVNQKPPSGTCAQNQTFTIGYGQATAPATAGTSTFTVAPGASVQPTVVVTTPTASISGIVYNDVNGNGTFDTGIDTGVSGVSVARTGTSSGTGTTDVNGAYSFIGLAPGTYNVDYTVPTGYSNIGTKPISGIVLAIGASSTGNNFFMRRSTATTLARTSGASPSTYGASLTFTATVTSASGINPSTGAVTFKDGAATVCSAVSLTGNTAVCSIATLSVAGSPHSITADYSGTTTARAFWR